MKVFRQFWLHWTVAGNVNYADQIKRNIKIGIAVHSLSLLALPAPTCQNVFKLSCDGTRLLMSCDVIARILLLETLLSSQSH